MVDYRWGGVPGTNLADDLHLGIRGPRWPFVAADPTNIPAVGTIIRELDGFGAGGYCPRRGSLLFCWPVVMLRWLLLFTALLCAVLVLVC